MKMRSIVTAGAAALLALSLAVPAAAGEEKVITVFHYMMPGSKALSHVKLACKWDKGFMTRPYMSK